MGDSGQHVYAYALLCFVSVTVLCQVIQKIARTISRRHFIREHGCKPPAAYVQRPPLFGLDAWREMTSHVQSHTFLEYQLGRFKRIGNTFQDYVLGRTSIFTIEPENIRTILALKSKDFGLEPERKSSFYSVFREGICTCNGPNWEVSRTLLRTQPATKQVADLQTLEKHVDHLIEVIPKDGSTVDLQDLFFRLTIDAAMELVSGQSVDSLVSPAVLGNGGSSSFFPQAFQEAQTIGIRWIRARPWGFIHGRSYANASSAVHEFVDRYVEKVVAWCNRKDSKSINKDQTWDPPNGISQNTNSDQKTLHSSFLDQVARPSSSSVLQRDATLHILLAGRGATAGLLSNLCHTLARRPDIWTKLRAEVAEVFGGDAPTKESLKDCKYLRYCINESLRLHPIVPINARRALVDTSLPLGGGPHGDEPIFIPKGTTVHYDAYSLHRQAAIFGPDAETFRPERWATLRPTRWQYVPFYAARPDTQAGTETEAEAEAEAEAELEVEVEAAYTLARLVQELRALEPRDSSPWTEKLSLSLSLASSSSLSPSPSLEPKLELSSLHGTLVGCRTAGLVGEIYEDGLGRTGMRVRSVDAGVVYNEGVIVLGGDCGGEGGGEGEEGLKAGLAALVRATSALEDVGETEVEVEVVEHGIEGSVT
ncbi:MAG: hypothetical protein M1819_007346 [Sarea resinae]|nr:MAG: hypothetical protein M1819_007346 [Sarea resinae]